ncbi:unnamed protein product [Zymoseptoria tritici ST99CH_1A5]|uniref:3D domain-containing protein n=2 Tax=Zymoseptoria tritici TaxID=1047171 RepID=A0A1X7S8G7_ZYMT9|nr:unnamed protein product [Zymoseptoria tritici ST99CH_3D7]SMR64255.1 unnamed protein product [Zymoseptoria tritici ST99CH_3D1]SMY29599.1 unnamed protein product [Zymoseptoria tritici ST99CH_1A5]
MRIHTAFLFGFLIGFINHAFASPSPKDKPKDDGRHVNTKCGKHEPGCGHAVSKHNEMKLKMFDGLDCTGKQVGDDAHIEKYECYHFVERPREKLSVNFLLPLSKVQNHCDVIFYDGKNCHGKVIDLIYGNRSEAYNAQSHCLVVPWLKSVMVSNCM